MEGFLGGGLDISGAASPDGTGPGISGEAVSVASHNNVKREKNSGLRS